MQLVSVALPVPLFQIFDYLLPENSHVVQGARVEVPFGSQKKIGIVVGFPQNPCVDLAKLKPIYRVLDTESLYSDALWRLLLWGAQYYHTALGEVLYNALPVHLRQGKSATQASKILWKPTLEGLQALENPKTASLSAKRQEALCAARDGEMEKGHNPYNASIWSALKKHEWIEEEKAPVRIQTWQEKLAGQEITRAENVLRLNTEQALALSLLESQQGFQTWLLDGVTGSGKTEIYLQYIAHILQQGKQVLVLVPEIGLTPQMGQRFRARFNVTLDMLHSNVKDNERLRIWQRVKSGQTAILIGTRSALFTPFQDLGLIILDEEHDRSFKQQDGWRYHGRDLSVVYAKILNIPILLGSATPSLETLHNVEQGKYRRLTLTKRAGKGSPLHHFVIDMKKQAVRNGLSVSLIEKIRAHLACGNQVLLFLNRRGFAPVLLCHECGWIVNCQHCDKPLTYHQKKRVLRCHHCGSQKAIPMQCGQCGSTYLITTGLGTEQLENNLQEIFPETLITRIDRDSTARKGALEKQLKAVEQGQSQILIGTQMLAKGHHFPNVTLVAILDVDGALFSLDYRAEEQLAQLYVQVSGRAGRAEKAGEVILQTHYKDHPLLHTLLAKGYGDFAKTALQQRKMIGLPPYSAQALIRGQSKNSANSEQLLQKMANYLQNLQVAELQILGPMPAPMAKKAGMSRWQLLLQHPNRQVLQKVLHHFPHDTFLSSTVRWHIDIDPQDLS